MQTRNAAGPQCLPARCIVVEGRHEDDRKRGTGSLELSPQFNSRHAAEMDIEEETVDLSCGSAIKEFFGRCEGLGCKTVRVQQVIDGP